MSELNPNHEVTKAVHDHWHKYCALLMYKFGVDHVVITLEDVIESHGTLNIVVQELHDGIHLRLVSPEEAERLARENGGLPS